MTSLFPIEINFTLFLQALGDWLSVPFKLVTSLGNEEFYILIMPLLFWCINSVMGIRAGVMLLLSGGIKDFLKVVIHTPRPYWVDTRVKAITTESSFGMPSGHSMDAASIWGVIAYSIKRRWATWLAILLIFLIGLSRIYLGVHFLLDVISGWLVGGLILWGYLTVEKRIARWINQKSLLIQVLLAFLLSMTLILLALLARLLVSGWQIPIEWTQNALLVGDIPVDPLDMSGSITLAGVAFGFLGGLAYWVKRHGLPEIGKKTYKLIFRYLLGMAGLAVIYVGLKLILPEEPELLGQVLRYIRYTLIGVWVTAIAPSIFRKLKI
jgi:membrane-associated phospholipid phosphatase